MLYLTNLKSTGISKNILFILTGDPSALMKNSALDT